MTNVQVDDKAMVQWGEELGKSIKEEDWKRINLISLEFSYPEVLQ